MTLLTLVTFGSGALGHEQRQVGAYTLAVGWRDEPALAGLLNAVEVEVRETATGKGVEELAKTLRLSITFGGSRAAFTPDLRSLGLSDPGHYLADLIPTKPGDYVFRLQGKIGTQDVNEVFESGPGRFDPVRSASIVAYPGQDVLDPAASRELNAIRGAADQTRLVAIAGLALGAIAFAFATLALRRRR